MTVAQWMKFKGKCLGCMTHARLSRFQYGVVYVNEVHFPIPQGFMGKRFKITRTLRIFLPRGVEHKQQHSSVSLRKKSNLLTMARPRVNNEIPSMSDTDKDKMFTCPYNKYHRISALKYPGHVALCRKVWWRFTDKDSIICSKNLFLWLRDCPVFQQYIIS